MKEDQWRPMHVGLLLVASRICYERLRHGNAEFVPSPKIRNPDKVKE